MLKMNCQAFKEMLVSGANNLTNKVEEINALNVFPVPDGDTGTNMNMTFTSGITEVLKMVSDNIGDTAKVLSKSMLMGARGNSGVILSQIVKGFYKAVEGKETLTPGEVADAFCNGARLAYKAVMRPVEGTILTVIRESSEKALEYYNGNTDCTVKEYMKVLVKEAEASLNRTPELLPVLKESGVVDSGGAGLVTIFKGFYAYLQGSPVKLKEQSETEEEIERGYLAELIIKTRKAVETAKLSSKLAKIGEDVKIGEDGGQLKVSVHTLKPGDVLNLLQSQGIFESIRIERLGADTQETLTFEEPIEHEKYAIITVCNGEGIEEMFRKLGVRNIVTGGQTMNPSTESFVNEIKKTNADHIIILPNNSNIIMAAKQAKEVMKGHSITVVESKTIPEGMAACIAFDQEQELADNLANMKEAMGNIRTGSVTTAVKDTTYYNLEIRKDDYIGISGKDIAVASGDMMQTTKELLKVLANEDSSFVTLIYGSDVSTKQAEEIRGFIEDSLDMDCELVNGHQELYPFIIGVE